MKKKKSLILPEIKIWNRGRSAGSLVLYRLRYLGFQFGEDFLKTIFNTSLWLPSLDHPIVSIAIFFIYFYNLTLCCNCLHSFLFDIVCFSIYPQRRAVRTDHYRSLFLAFRVTSWGTCYFRSRLTSFIYTYIQGVPKMLGKKFRNKFPTPKQRKMPY
jgi:hypothetical protein